MWQSRISVECLSVRNPTLVCLRCHRSSWCCQSKSLFFVFCTLFLIFSHIYLLTVRELHEEILESARAYEFDRLCIRGCSGCRSCCRVARSLTFDLRRLQSAFMDWTHVWLQLLAYFAVSISLVSSDIVVLSAHIWNVDDSVNSWRVSALVWCGLCPSSFVCSFEARFPKLISLAWMESLVPFATGFVLFCLVLPERNRKRKREIPYDILNALFYGFYQFLIRSFS